MHERIIRARTAAELRAEFYRKGVMRLEDRWAGAGDARERYRAPKHVYADDLDVFGYGGLFGRAIGRLEELLLTNVPTSGAGTELIH